MVSLLQQSSIWISWFGPDRAWLVNFFGERLAVVLLALSLAGFLALLGQKRKHYFLSFGNPKAPAQGLHLSWTIVGPLIAIPLAALILAGILAMNPLKGISLAAILPLLPSVFLLALMNAFGEELAFRAAASFPTVAGCREKAGCLADSTLVPDWVIITAVFPLGRLVQRFSH